MLSGAESAREAALSPKSCRVQAKNDDVEIKHKRNKPTMRETVPDEDPPIGPAGSLQKKARVEEAYAEGRGVATAAEGADKETRKLQEEWEIWEPEGLRPENPVTFVPREPPAPLSLLETVKVLSDASFCALPVSLPFEDRRIMAAAVTICRCALRFVRADSKNELLLCTTFMAATGQKYRSHVDGLYRYDEAGAFVQVKTVAAEDVAFLHTSLRFAECLMRSLPSNLDRKDHLLVEEVRKVVRGENFDAASFVDKVLGSIVPARRGEEHSWKMDFVSLLVSVRGDLCSAAGLRGAIQSYHRWWGITFYSRRRGGLR